MDFFRALEILRRNVAFRIAVAVIALIACALIYVFWHDSNLKNFKLVEKGMSRSQLSELMGPADREESCDWKFAESHDPLCSKILIYRTAVPMVPEFNVAFIGRDGKVIDKYVYVSP